MQSQTMSSLNSLLLIVTVVLMHCVVTIVISQESCNVCNCQFSNIQVLDQLIEANSNLTQLSLVRIKILNHN